MANTPNRQSHLGSVPATPRLGNQTATEAEEVSRALPTLDIHIHLFGTGDSGSGCRISQTITEGRAFQDLCSEMGFRHRAPTLDEGYALASALEQGCTVVACHCGTGWTTDALRERIA